MKTILRELWVLILIGIIFLGILVYQVDKEMDRRVRVIYTHLQQP